MSRGFCRPAAILLLAFCGTNLCCAHPGSGIVVDDRGTVYFTYSGHGVMRLDASGRLTTIHADPGGHWLALDATGAFAQATPLKFQRVTPDGSIPALIFASGGAPIAVGDDGFLYYGADSTNNGLPPGARSVARFRSHGERALFSPGLQEELANRKDGITGLAAGPNGSIYVATWNGVIILARDGSIAKVMHPVAVPGCDSDPADHNPANASSPLLRGLAVDALGNIYVAATSCHRLIRIDLAGHVTSILASERPWSPTGVAVRGGDVYVLEYTNANGPKTEGWRPRIRKRIADGSWTTITEVTAPSEANLTGGH
jgi:hypothetical protein